MKKASASSPPAKPRARKESATKTRELIARRLRKDRPMSTVTLRMPEDVVEDLKRIAPALGFSGYQPLIRAYIGRGLRVDLARLQSDPIPQLVESLRRRGVAEAVIAEAVADVTSH
jgi:hypothetical protein